MGSKGQSVNKNDYFIVTISVRGLIYKVYLYPPSIFEKFHPDCYACIEESSKELHFSEEHRELTTIRHEIVHAYIKSCFYDYVPDGTPEGLEEVVCEVVSHILESIQKTSDYIKGKVDQAYKKRSETNEIK